MVTHAFWDQYQSYVNECCVFSEKSLDHDTVIACNDIVLTKLRKQLEDPKLQKYVVLAPPCDGSDFVNLGPIRGG